MVAQDDVRVGVRVVREGEEFEVLDVGSDLETKAPNDANWHPAVIYRSTSPGDNKRRVRPFVDFCQKFSIPQDDNELEDNG